MPATHQDIEITQGDDEPFIIKIYQPDGVTPASEADVSAAFAVWRWFPVKRVGRTETPGASIGTKTSDPNASAGSNLLTFVAWTDPDTGTVYQTIQGSLSHVETAALVYPGSYSHECKISLSGNVTTTTVGDLPLRAQPK